MSTLNENINRVSVVLEDIKEAIQEKGGTVGDCTSPEEYGDAIRALSSTGGSGGSCTCDLSPYAKTTYVDAQDADTLARAKAYADSIFGTGPDSSVSKGYVDEHDSQTLDAAKSFAVAQDLTTLNAAKTYADGKDADILAQAKAYAKGLAYDEGAGATIAYVDERDEYVLNQALSHDAVTLQEAKAYADSLKSADLDTVIGPTTNAVQNKAIYEALMTKQDKLDGDSTLFSLKQGDKATVDVKYGSLVTIDAGGNTSVIAGDVHVVIDNDTKFIGVGSDGIYNGADYTFKSNVAMKYGAESMTITNIVPTISNPKVTYTVSSDNSYITWTIKDGAVLTNTLDIPVAVTAIHSAFDSAKTESATVQIVGVKTAEDGVSYDLDLNYSYILGKLNANDDNYTYTPSMTSPITAKIYYTSGKTRTAVGGTASGYLISYHYDNGSEVNTGSTISYDDTLKAYTIKVPTPSTSNKFLHISLYKDNVLWDHETLGIVKDGARGEDAPSTAELIIVDDTKYIGTGSDFIYNGSTIEHTSTAYMTFAGEKVDSTITISNNGAINYSTPVYNASTKTYTIKWSIANGTNLANSVNAKITATATVDSVTKTAEGIVSFVGVKGAADGVSYEIVPDYDFIIGDAGETTGADTFYTYTPDNITCTVYYTVGNTRTIATDTDLTIKRIIGNNVFSQSVNAATGKVAFAIQDDDIRNVNRVTFELYKGTVLWDTENLAIIKNGVKGKAGDAGTSINLTMAFAAEADFSEFGMFAQDVNNIDIAAKYQYPVGTAYTPSTGDYLVATNNTAGTDLTLIEAVQVYRYSNGKWSQYNLDSTTSNIGVAGVSPATGHIIMWNGSQWVDIGTIRGGYVHQKFANRVYTDSDKAAGAQISYLDNIWLKFTNPVDGVAAGEMPGEYIGILVDNNSIASTSVADYKWARWEGEDGYGMEQIFFLGTSDKTPTTPSYAARHSSISSVSEAVWNSYDYEPIIADLNYGGKADWVDHPVAPTKDKNVCWYSWRMLSSADTTKQVWQAPQPYLVFAQDGKDATVAHIQNGNVTVLVDPVDGVTTLCDDIETCKFDLSVEGVDVTSGMAISLADAQATAVGITVSPVGTDGTFTFKVPKGKNLTGVARAQVNCLYDTKTYVGYVSISKIPSTRNYNISATPELIHQDPYDGSYDNVTDNKINFVITKEVVSGGKTTITNTASHSDYKITYKRKNEAETEYTGADSFILFADGTKTLEKLSIYSNETSGWVLNDTIDFVIVANGANGMDSDIQEFVYWVQDSGLAAPAIYYKEGVTTFDATQTASYVYTVGTTTKNYADADWCPIAEKTGTTIKRWTDSPSSIDEGQTEWMAYRTKEAVVHGQTAAWSAFSTPVVWSVYGKEGKDGDGVEYVFYTTANDTPPNISNSQGVLKGQEGIVNTQPKVNPDWLPLTGSDVTDHWTDNPIDVTKDKPYQWVSKRKYALNAAGTTKEWGQFSLPTKWSVYAESSTKADLDNEYILIGTGADMVLNVTTTVPNISATLVNGNTSCTNLQITKVEQDGVTKTVSTTTNSVSFDNKITINFDTSTFNSSAVVFGVTIGADADLSNTQYIKFTVEGKIGTQPYAGTAVLRIAGLKGAEEGVFYSIITNPTAISVDEKGDYYPSNVIAYINKTVGNSTEVVTTLPIGYSLKWRKDNSTEVPLTLDATTGRISINQSNFKTAAGSITFVLRDAGNTILDAETVLINRAAKSIKLMEEIYTIAKIADGTPADPSSATALGNWDTTIADALGKCADVSELVELDDKGYNLWNAMLIEYTDGTIVVTDKNNLGNGIRQVVEYYQKTNPGVIITDDNIAANKPNGTQVAIEASSSDWKKVMPSLTARYDCLWNVEYIVGEDDSVKVTEVALINQLVHGESPYSLRIENQYPQISCDGLGSVITTNNSNIFTSTCHMYYGKEELTTNVSYKVSPYAITVKNNSNISYTCYCVGKNTDGSYLFKYDEAGTVYFNVRAATIYNTQPTIFGGIANSGYSIKSISDVKRLVINDNIISSTSEYTPNKAAVDCFSYVEATYDPDGTTGPIPAVVLTDCIATHNVLKGASGVPYTYWGEWEPGKDYYATETHIDLVKRTVGDTVTYYICNNSHNSDTSWTTVEAAQWSTFEGQYESLATGLLLAEECVIDKLKVNAADIVGTLSAKQIDVTNLRANELHVLDTNNKEVVTVDNVDIQSMSNSYSKFNASTYYNKVTNSAGANKSVSLANNVVLATFTVESGANSPALLMPKFEVNWSVCNYTTASATASPDIELVLTDGSSTKSLWKQTGIAGECHSTAGGKITSNAIPVDARDYTLIAGETYQIKLNATAHINSNNAAGCSSATINVTFPYQLTVKYNGTGDGVVIGYNGVAVRKGNSSIAIGLNASGVYADGLVMSDAANGVKEIKIINDETQATDTTGATLYILIP